MLTKRLELLNLINKKCNKKDIILFDLLIDIIQHNAEKGYTTGHIPLQNLCLTNISQILKTNPNFLNNINSEILERYGIFTKCIQKNAKYYLWYDLLIDPDYIVIL